MSENKKDIQEDQYDLPYHWLLTPDSYRGRQYYGYVNYLLENFVWQNKNVLDAGCGDGRLSYLLSSRGARVIGCDFSEKSILWAKTLAPNVDFLVADLLNYKTEKVFNYILLVEVIEHLTIESVVPILKSLGSFLEAEGRIIITVPSDNIPVNDKHFQHFNPDKLKKIVQDSGFILEKIVNFGFNNRLLNLIYKFLDNRIYDIKPLSRWFNTKIYPKFLLQKNNNQTERFIVVLKKN